LNFYPLENKIEIPGATFQTKLIPKGYRVDVFLPSEGLVSNNFIFDKEFNFSYGINDADADVRESQVMWSGSEMNYCDPTAYGRLERAPK